MGGTVTTDTGGQLVTCNIPDNVDPTKAAQTDTGTKSASTATPQDSLACSLSNPSVCLANVVYAFTVGLGSGMAYVGGFMFDTTVSLSLNSAAYALSFLSTGWTAARDLANMGFILLLVYIAYTIMLQAETAGTMRMLAWVIFIALIINFSFFFTRVVIDVGNILAVQFYNSIDAPSLQQTMDATSAQTGVLANTAAGIASAASPQGSLANTKDLTSSIMNALNIQSLFSNQNFRNFADQSSFGTKFIILAFIYIAIGACYFILAAMFFTVAIKFIARVVILWFLIIASPLAFICKAVPGKPQISSLYDRWQHELVMHAFYPAFFLFIFFFISTIMKNFGGTGGILNSMADSLNAAASNPNLSGFIFIASAVANVAIRLGFVVAMLYIALKASEYMGVTGAQVASRATSAVFGQTGRLISAPAGFVGRQTFGRAGTALVNSKYLETRAKNAPTFFGRGVFTDLNRASKAVGGALGKASYDPRNAPGTSVIKKGVERITSAPVSAGTPTQGGFIAQAKERDERRKAAEKEQKARSREEENLKAIKDLAEKSAKHDDLAAKEKAGTITAPERTQKDVLKRQITQIENKVNGLNKAEIESYKMADIQKVIKHLNKDTVKKINDSDKFSEADKEKVRTTHDQATRDSVGEKGVQKSQEIIEELRGLRQALTTNGSVSAASLTRLEHATTAGNTLNMAAIRDAENEVKRQKLAAEAVQLSAASTQEAKDKAKYAVEKINEVRSHIEKLKQSINDVPETVGGTPNSKEFLIA